MLFDILFITQHYCLYPRGAARSRQDDSEREPLAEDGEAGEHEHDAHAHEELPYEANESDTQRSTRSTRSNHSNASQQVKYFPVSYNENGNGVLSSPTNASAAAAGTSARSDFASFAVGSTSVGRSFSHPRSPLAPTTSSGQAATAGGAGTFINAFGALPSESERVDVKVGLGSLGRSATSQLPRSTSATLPPSGHSFSINGDAHHDADSSVTRQTAFQYEQQHQPLSSQQAQPQHQRAVSQGVSRHREDD